ncbi:hypothetical protein Thiosp_03192 [Thiorhodovibrio litoralis]|nr:hypothetical protein Thiosp_03192 [Thiorhodovibrio litoralis]
MTPMNATQSDTNAVPCPNPDVLLAREDLSREDKITHLHQWELDLREKLVADEESMTSDLAADDPCQASEQLAAVLQALERLGSGAEAHPTPTKQG